MILVSLHDLKADTWTPPHVVQNKAAALREFESLVNDSQHTLVSDHASDFDMFQIGEYDSDTGVVAGFSLADFVKVANGSEVKHESN